MTLTPEQKITNVDRLCGGVAITFEDGMGGLYSPELLRELLSRPTELNSDLEPPPPEFE
jgi:hypothetical protein